MSVLTPGQSQFASRLAASTGLHPGVIAAWLLAEESGGAAHSRQAAGNHDWLNIGYTDSATLGAGNSVWRNPISAADATAKWLRGQWNDPGFGRASSGIQSIVRTAHQSPAQQIAAIQHSGWASSGYPDLPSLFSQYGGAAPSVPTTGRSGTGPRTKLVPRTSTSTSFSGGQPDIQAAGAAALLKGADRPINTTGKVQTSHLLSDLVSNIDSGFYKTPSQANTQTTTTQQRVTVPGVKGVKGSVTLPGSTLAGGFLPKGAIYTQNRKDQGRDGATNPGGAIVAPGDGYVVRVGSDPAGFGPRYPIIHFTSGKYAGHTMYVGHTLSVLSPGAHFHAGQVLSHTGTHGVGNATVPGWFEIGYANSGTPGPFGQAVPF